MEKLNLKQKNTLLDCACNSIYELYDLLKDSNLIYGLPLPESCYTNFKDAAFHYHKMYISSDANDLFKQFFALDEHICRAKSDYFISVLYLLSQCLESIIRSHYKTRVVLRSPLNLLKKYQYLIRYSGMQIKQHSQRIGNEEFYYCVEKCFAAIDDNNLLAEFEESLQEYKSHL